MRVVIIGRTEVLFETALFLKENNINIVAIITAKAAPEYKKSESDFKNIAELWKIPFASGGNLLKHKELIKTIKPDIGISINYPTVISQEILDLFPFGILNAHGGDLPRYRGNACYAWAIINGETKIGLCVHKMIGGELDSGDIIAREYLNININTKIGEVIDWSTITSPKLFLHAVKKLTKQNNYILEKQSKNPNDALRCYPRIPEDGRINWKQSNEDILRLINASNYPYSGAYCFNNNQKLIIRDAELVKEPENICAMPGQVSLISNEYIEVICQEGKIRIFEIEFNGKITNSSDIIKSIRTRLA